MLYCSVYSFGLISDPDHLLFVDMIKILLIIVSSNFICKNFFIKIIVELVARTI